MEADMGRRLVLIAACGIVVACGEVSEPVVDRPAPPSFTLFGIIRDDTGAPVAGANAKIVNGRFRDLSSVSTDSGYFSFSAVSGPMKVRVRKDGFHGYERDIVVVSDRLLEVTLSKVAFVELPLGATVRAKVAAADPPCDPFGWDALAPCRRFDLTATATGVLVVSITWRDGSPLDAALMAPNGSYLATSEEVGLNELVVVQATVEAGNRYELRVHSYYGSQEFDVRADLIRR
jgi:hypothetical protein